MAWTEQAWRHSLAGLPDPSQATTELQWRLSLAGVNIGSTDLSSFTPLTLDYDEALSFHSIPEPSDLDVTKRYALAAVPAIGLSDSTSRDGDIDTTISAFVADFDGTVVNPTIDGDILSVLSSFGSALSGSFQYRHYFDIEYSVTPTWVVWEQPANFGDVTTTLGAFTCALTGYALPPDSTQGRVETALDAFTADLDGTFEVAPARDGQILVNINNFTNNITGSFFVTGVAGEINSVLSGFDSGLSGTFAVWNTDGALGNAVGSFASLVQGQYVSSGSTIGTIESVISAFSSGFTGTSVVPADIDSAIMRVDSTEVAHMEADTAASAKMRT